MRFGEFTLDAAAGELHRGDARVRLQDLPFRMLVILASRPGEVVTREELRAALWGAETYVDAEAGLNTAIAKIREALDDEAGAPKYVQTIPKRGYRFVAAVHQDVAPLERSEDVMATVEHSPLGATASMPTRRWIAFAAVALVVAATALGGRHIMAVPARPVVAVVQFHNETGDASYDRLAQQLTDAAVVALAQDPGLAVIGNAAVLRTPRIFSDLVTIRDTLHADAIIVAQLQNPPDGLTVRLHFIRASDQTHVWATNVPAAEASVVGAALEGAARTVR